MEGTDFDEAEFFGAIARSGARALLIGRRALIVLGMPLLTADYDFWLHADDASLLNAAAEPFGLVPTRTPEEARSKGRYALENDEHVDVLVARSVSTTDGKEVEFDGVWTRRQTIQATPAVPIAIPCIDDLILTKRFGGRQKDLEDIRLLEAYRRGGE